MKAELLILGSIIHEKVINPFNKRGEFSIGGSAVYAAMSACQFAKVGIISAIGSDFIDQKLLFLKKKNISSDSVMKIKGNTLIWEAAYNSNGNIIKQKVDLGIYKNYKPIVNGENKNPKILFIESTNPRFGLDVLEQLNAPTFVALDTRDYYINNHFKDLKKLLGKVDMLFLNEDELSLITRRLGLEKFSAEQLLTKYTNLKVLFIKKGAAGLNVFTRDEVTILKTAKVKKVVDPTGAGDALAGAILGKMARQKKINLAMDNLVEFAKIGMVMASLVIEKRSFSGIEEVNSSTIAKRLKLIGRCNKKYMIMPQKTSNILEKIVANKKREVMAKKRKKSIKKIKRECSEYLSKNKNNHRSLRQAILSGNPLGLIAEIKLASPTAGQLTELSCVDIARIYANSKADVISVLTDRTYFNGRPSYLKKVRKICHQPIFRKDFIIDQYQIYETALAGGDAFLLIATVLTIKEMENFMKLGNALGLEYLVEVHDEDDLKKAIMVGAEIIGINNRNLKTMKIDLSTTEKLAEKIPSGKIIISESGFNTQNDVRKILKSGANGILVGASIIKSKNMIKKINEFKQIRK